MEVEVSGAESLRALVGHGLESHLALGAERMEPLRRAIARIARS